MDSFHSIAGKLAGLLSLLGFVPYVIATVRGKNRPNRATWVIWTIVGFALFFSYEAAGATHTLWVTASNVLAFAVVLVLSFKYGEGGWGVFDLFCLGGAGLGLAAWWYFHSPLPTLFISILIDLIGALPTLKKSYFHPEGEDLLTWICFWIANAINLFAIEQWSVSMALYPLYLFFLSGTTALILAIRGKKTRS